MNTNWFCPHCGNKVEHELDINIEYPYVCRHCDENFYEFELNSLETGMEIEINGLRGFIDFVDRDKFCVYYPANEYRCYYELPKDIRIIN